MFIKDRDYLKGVLHNIQRKHCSYDGASIGIGGDPPPYCDCKYGYDLVPFGEKTGCPELRCIVELLALMTDKEYIKIMRRGKNIVD